MKIVQGTNEDTMLYPDSYRNEGFCVLELDLDTVTVLAAYRRNRLVQSLMLHLLLQAKTCEQNCLVVLPPAQHLMFAHALQISPGTALHIIRNAAGLAPDWDYLVGCAFNALSSDKNPFDLIETIILDSMRVHKRFRNTDRESLRKIDMQTMLELLNGE